MRYKIYISRDKNIYWDNNTIDKPLSVDGLQFVEILLNDNTNINFINSDVMTFTCEFFDITYLLVEDVVIQKKYYYFVDDYNLVTNDLITYYCSLDIHFTYTKPVLDDAYKLNIMFINLRETRWSSIKKAVGSGGDILISPHDEYKLSYSGQLEPTHFSQSFQDDCWKLLYQKSNAGQLNLAVVTFNEATFNIARSVRLFLPVSPFISSRADTSRCYVYKYNDLSNSSKTRYVIIPDWILETEMTFQFFYPSQPARSEQAFLNPFSDSPKVDINILSNGNWLATNFVGRFNGPKMFDWIASSTPILVEGPPSVVSGKYAGHFLAFFIYEPTIEMNIYFEKDTYHNYYETLQYDIFLMGAKVSNNIYTYINEKSLFLNKYYPLSVKLNFNEYQFSFCPLNSLVTYECPPKLSDPSTPIINWINANYSTMTTGVSIAQQNMALGITGNLLGIGNSFIGGAIGGEYLGDKKTGAITGSGFGVANAGLGIAKNILNFNNSKAMAQASFEGYRKSNFGVLSGIAGDNIKSYIFFNIKSGGWRCHLQPKPLLGYLDVFDNNMELYGTPLLTWELMDIADPYFQERSRFFSLDINHFYHEIIRYNTLFNKLSKKYQSLVLASIEAGIRVWK